MADVLDDQNDQNEHDQPNKSNKSAQPEFIYKYDQFRDTDRMPYSKVLDPSCTFVSKNIHMGQLKLLMTEIMFLSKKAKPHNKVIYVGAAPGYHIIKLIVLFPDLTFELWDKREFDIKEGPRCKIYRRYFEDKDAQMYSKEGPNILFMSDIRSLEFNRVEEQNDSIIMADNNMQSTWAKIIRPISAYLKFRTPYGDGVTSYLTGTIYLQCYAPLSAETRLMTNDYDTIVEYNNVEFDEKMSYFNCRIRGDDSRLRRWRSIMSKHNIKNNWDNNAAFYILSLYLHKMRGVTGKTTKSNNDNDNDNDEEAEQIVKLFDEIIKFFRDKYHKKYDYVYRS